MPDFLIDAIIEMAMPAHFVLEESAGDACLARSLAASIPEMCNAAFAIKKANTLHASTNSCRSWNQTFAS